MNIRDVCRLCLVKSVKKADELFCEIDNSFEQKFYDLTNIVLNDFYHEEIPKQACMSCITEVEQYHNYRKQLIEKQKRLNSLLGIIVVDSRSIESVESQNESNSHFGITTEDDNNFEENVEEGTELQATGDFKDSEIIVMNVASGLEQDQEDEEEYIDELITEEVLVPADEENSNQIQEIYIVQNDEEVLQEEFIGYEEEIDQRSSTEDKYSDDENEDQNNKRTTRSARKRKDKGRPRLSKNESDVVEKKFKCWIKGCYLTFGFRSSIKRHMIHTHGINVTKSSCLVCGKDFEQYHEYLKHYRNHSRKSKCDVCMLTFVNDEKLEIHKNLFHAEKSDDNARLFACEICGARFKRQEHLTSHNVYKHTDNTDRPFKCPKCPSSFMRISDIRNHQKKSHLQIMKKCIYCDYSRRDHKSIKNHAKLVHNSENIYRCDNCEAEFPSHKLKAFHMRRKCFDKKKSKNLIES